MSSSESAVYTDLDKRLEKIYSDVLREQGYTGDTEKLRMIVELIKEQVQNENSDHTAR